MTRRTASAFYLDQLESRRLLTGYVLESDLFDGIDLVPGASGVVELLNGSDDGFGTIVLPDHPDEPGTYMFHFYGQKFDELRVSVNGLITFVNGSSDANNGDLTTSPPQRTIAVLWDDWDTSVGGTGATDSSVLYKFDFDRDELIIEWNNVTHLNVGGDNGVTFHAVLDLEEADDSASSNSKVELHYKDLVVGNAAHDEGRSATVGIKDVGVQGPNRLLVAQDGAGPLPSWVGSNKAMEIGDGSSSTPFAHLSTNFGFLTDPHTLTLVFNQPVSGVDAADLTVTPVGGGPSFSPVSASTNSLAATFTFDGLVADGRFNATIPAGAINTASGAPTTSPVSAQFFFLRGDANRDAAVNLQDFNILAGNFGASPRTFSQGDFNYDGTVNLSDFNILASRFGTVLPPAAAASTTDVVNTVRSGAADSRSPFGESRIGDDEDRGEDELLA